VPAGVLLLESFRLVWRSHASEYSGGGRIGRADVGSVGSVEGEFSVGVAIYLVESGGVSMAIDHVAGIAVRNPKLVHAADRSMP
jgi:hypothetical protein